MAASDDELAEVATNYAASMKVLANAVRLPSGYSDCGDRRKGITLLAYLDAVGYARRCTKSVSVLFPSVLARYVGQIRSFVAARDEIGLALGRATFELGDARRLSLPDSSIDAVITSPPYSFAIDYADNDRPQLEYLGHRVEDIRGNMIGLQGRGISGKLAAYFESMDASLSEMNRVLKHGCYAVVIIGSNDIQTKGVRLETRVTELAENRGFVLDRALLKPIKGIQNTMKDEYILFLRKNSPS
jgi:hypothetical protein